MKNENSNLVSGLLLGAAIGACATYLIIRNRNAIKKSLENAGEKVKHGIHEFAEKAKNKAEEFGNKTAGSTYTNEQKDQSKNKAV